MSWLTNFVYEESKAMFDCQEGVNAMCIKSVEEGQTKDGNRMIVVYCNVKNSNGEQLRHYLVEGQYFDKNLSRFMDCFGIPYIDVDYRAWINKIGNARFDHFRYDGTLKKTVQVPELQCHLLPKEGFKQSVTPKPTTAPETNSMSDIPENIPF